MDTIRVLVSDNHPVFRYGLTQLLDQQVGIQVVAQAANGEETVKLAKEFRPEVAIIDIVLSDTDGMEAVKEIKAFLPDTAILVLSAYDYEAYMLASLRAGASGYILKDAPAGKLVEAVRLVHDGGMVFKGDKFRELFGKVQNHSNGDVPQPSNLPEREKEILLLVARGMSNHDISVQIKISERTVENHLGRVFRRLKVNSRTELVSCALREGWLTINDLKS